MKKTSILLALVMLSALLLGGCFGVPGTVSTPSATITPSPDIPPDRLISRGEAEALVGNALKEPTVRPTARPIAQQYTPVPGSTLSPSVAPTASPALIEYVMCFYDSAVKGDRFLQISVLQNTPYMAAQGIPVKNLFDRLRSPGPGVMSDPTLMVVENVGDEAYILPPGIHIMFQGYYIVIGVGDPVDPDNEKILVEAGRLAVKNLAAILGVPAPTDKPTAPPPTSSAQ
jgi:hypothetical protein